MMGTVSPGFKGRGRRREPSAELPPGQYLVDDFPVLSAGPTPAIDLEDWEFTITNETGDQRRWDWAAFRQLPSEPVTVDIHCVTHWSKLGTSWEGVSLDTLLTEVETSAGFALAGSYGGYSWSPICICGRAPSGSAGSSCWTPTSRASGRAWAITATATRGASNGTGATDLDGRQP